MISDKIPFTNDYCEILLFSFITAGKKIRKKKMITILIMKIIIDLIIIKKEKE